MLQKVKFIFSVSKIVQNQQLFRLPNLNYSQNTKSFKEVIIRHNFHKECEEGLNKQINLELQASYTYFCLSTCLSRPDVALPGYARFFAAAATEERHHAELLASFVNSRGGDVALRDVPAPSLAPVHDPVVALHHSIDLERSVLASLEELHKIASTHGDSYLTDFLEEHFISEGYKSIRQLAEMLTKLQRAGSAEGVELLDLDLLRHPPKICERYKK